MQIDIILTATVIGIVATAGGAILKAINLIRYVEGRLDGLKAEQQLQKHQIDAALSLLDYRIRDLERYTESAGDFTTRYKRDENTGAPFLRRQE